MRLKENTEKSSDQLRGIAGIVLGLGLAIAILFIIAGIATIINGSSYYRRTLLDMILGSNSITFFVLGGFVFIYHYLAYVMISAYATLIENSDRTDVVNALYVINDTLRKNNEFYKPVNNRNISKTTEYTEPKKQESDEEVELEKIDISGMNDD